uniref:CSON010175 protein n=2 Tax=Culicoides sonorensis TaxID=179676 RepID=A0A336LPY9_CULSO
MQSIYFIFVIFKIAQAKNFDIGLESLNCNFNSSICFDPICFVKLIPFKNGLLNFGCNLKEPTSDLWFHFTLSYTINGLMKQNLIDVDDNVCHYFRGKIQSPVIADLLTALYYADPRKLHPCPYSGQLRMTNLDLDMLTSHLPGIIPPGRYSLVFSVRNQNNFTIGNIKIKFQIQRSVECMATT